METKNRRVRRTPESYRKEVEEITNGEYSVLGSFVNVRTKILHVHNVCGVEWGIVPRNFLFTGNRCPKCSNRARRTPEGYRKEVEDSTNGEYSVLGEFKNAKTKIEHLHIVCGTVWDIDPSSFVSGRSKCPECYRVRKSRTSDSYVREVSEITNGEYSVLGIFATTKDKITHVHNECGYKWDVSPNHFVTTGTRCPKCSGGGGRPGNSGRDLVVDVLDRAGDEYSILENHIEHHKKINVLHLPCGSAYEILPYSFLKGVGCPRCFGTTMSDGEFKKRVYDLVGDEYSFLDSYVNTRTHLEVKHAICGHCYLVSPQTFFRGSRCPNCIYSRGEKAVADVLDSLSIEYSREHTFEYLGRKRYDFFIPSLNIAIEYDGKQHFEARDFFGGEEALKRTQESDALKNDFCEYMGIDLLRIPHWEFDNIDEIVTNFIDTVKLMRSISANGSEMEKCR